MNEAVLSSDRSFTSFRFNGHNTSDRKLTEAGSAKFFVKIAFEGKNVLIG